MSDGDPIRGLAALLGVLTIIPSRGSIEEAARWFGAAPVIGFVRGLLTSIPLLAIGRLPPYAVAALALAMHYLGQGFMHADGFSDFSEALLASRSGADPRSVLKDTHRGSFAVASFSVMAILLFSSSIRAVSSGFLLAFVIAEIGEVAAIAAALGLGRIEPYEGMARAFKERTGAGTVAAIYAMSAVLIFLLGGGPMTLTVPIAALAVGCATALAANRVVGYVNGDALGFAGEVAFLATLLLVRA